MSKKPTIVRATHDKENSFTVISNEFLKDKRLSFKARGLFCYLLSLQDDWKINVEEVCKHCPEGIKSIRSSINELIRFGYLTVQKIRNEKGVFTHGEYTRHESPLITKKSIQKQAQATSSGPDFPNPHVDNPHVGEPHVDKGTYIKYLPLENTDLIKQQQGEVVCSDKELGRGPESKVVVLENLLIELGVETGLASELVSSYDESIIKANVTYSLSKSPRSMSAYVVEAIKKNFAKAYASVKRVPSSPYIPLPKGNPDGEAYQAARVLINSFCTSVKTNPVVQVSAMYR